MASLTLGSTVSKRAKVLDPTIINNDMEVPNLTEERQRPALDFVPLTKCRIKTLKAVKKSPVIDKKSPALQGSQTERKHPRAVESEMLSGDDLKHVQAYMLHENGLEREVNLIDTLSVRISDNEVKELRKSRDQLKKTPSFI